MRTYAIAFFALVLLFAAYAFTTSAQQFSYARENILFAIDPSAERAFTYGERHFNAMDPDAYGLDRAEYFYTKAAALDPTTPYLFHELARVAFLRGNLTKALALISIQISQSGGSTKNSYYVRGLIQGYRGAYHEAALDYETYLRSDSTNWAAITDYAWVLIKDDRPREALIALDWGLMHWPTNPWLLNSKAIALMEMNRPEDAKVVIDQAQYFVLDVSEESWMEAYPGNDPLIAPQGVAALKKAVAENMHTIIAALDDGEKDVR